MGCSKQIASLQDAAPNIWPMCIQADCWLGSVGKSREVNPCPEDLRKLFVRMVCLGGLKEEPTVQPQPQPQGDLRAGTPRSALVDPKKKKKIYPVKGFHEEIKERNYK